MCDATYAPCATQPDPADSLDRDRTSRLKPARWALPPETGRKACRSDRPELVLCGLASDRQARQGSGRGVVRASRSARPALSVCQPPGRLWANALAEHSCQGRVVDLFVLVDRDCPRGRVVMAVGSHLMTRLGPP